MRNPQQWVRPAVALSAAVVLAAGAAVVIGGGAGASLAGAGQPPKARAGGSLSAHDIELLDQARARGDARVTLIVLTDRGQAGAVSDRLAALGGTVGRRSDAVGYLRASVPTDAVGRAAALPGIATVDLNERVALPPAAPESRPGSRPAARDAAAGPGPDTPAANPFLPTADTGAVAFRQAHPTWDGRGVTIGILDTGVDLDQPALQTTSTGQRKIVDWITETDPVIDNDPTWRPMLTEVSGPSFTFAGEQWSAPAGTWRINRLTEASTGIRDLNRDGDTTDRFGVLYDPAGHDIRVDTDQDHDFGNNPVLRPYAERFDVGHFGADRPGTDVLEQVPFVVQFREDVDLTPAGQPGTADFVNIGLVEGRNGTALAGVAAANDILGNPSLDGAAPGATLVSARACLVATGCTAAGISDGLVDLVANHHVDVVNVAAGAQFALNDGNNSGDLLYDRLIADYGVQIVVGTGGRGPGLNTVSTPGSGTTTITAGAGISRQTFVSNLGSAVRVPYQALATAGRGPREDGGLKPNVLAPGSAVTTALMFEPGSGVPEAGYSLPVGLATLQGTGVATAQTTGAGALLLSAAAGTGRRVAPPVLRRAVYASARFVPGIRAEEQGNGLLDVPFAWRLLTAGVTAGGYQVSAPVCTPLAQLLPTPGQGTGVYNRCAAADGGQQPGADRTYAVHVTRTTGAAGPVEHTLQWLGNDGTFSVPTRVVLPLNEPVKVPVTAHPAAGAHSAILRLDDPATPGVDAESMQTVVAADPATATGPGFSGSVTGTVDRNGTTSYFVTVPAGASALQVNLSGLAAGSQTRWIAVNPRGVQAEDNSGLACFANFSDPQACNPTARSYLNPLPGVWELAVESRRTSPVLDNPFTLTAKVQAVTVDPAVTELPTATIGQPAPVSWTLTNRFGPIRVTGAGGPLGSQATARPLIRQGDQQTYDLAVPAGATRLDVSIGNVSAPADLDLYLFKDGVRVALSAGASANESLSLANPAPGAYQVLVDGFNVPDAGVEYDYRDAFTAPALGRLDVPATATTLPTGGSSVLSGSVTVQTAPAAGRRLFGQLAVTNEDGGVVGRGTVTVAAVS